jgi:hypothetical protein
MIGEFNENKLPTLEGRDKFVYKKVLLLLNLNYTFAHSKRPLWGGAVMSERSDTDCAFLMHNGVNQ